MFRSVENKNVLLNQNILDFFKKFKIFDFISAPKKYFWAFFVFLSSLIAFFPNRNFVHAGFWSDLSDSISSLPINLPMAIVGTIFWAIAQIAVFLSGLAYSFLNWVLSPNFMPYSYTNPNNNEVIKIGLSVTQSFVNMLLVVVLIYIALATILRIAGYETRKALVLFIIVALVVNFAPVICGLIVDASNITMKFFLNPQSQDSNSITTDVTSSVSNGVTLAAGQMWENVLSGTKGRDIVAKALGIFMVSIIVSLMSFFIYIIFAFVFIVRYFAIWILVILSPIAFACYVLPRTRKFSNMWLEQFVQWSIVGVTCAFFLYLANYFYKFSFDKIMKSASLGEPFVENTPIFPLIIPIIFLLIGLIYGLQTSAIGASAVMKFTQRGIKGVGGKTGKALGRARGVIGGGTTLTGTTVGRALASDMGKRFSAGLAKLPSIGEVGAGRGTFAKWGLRGGAAILSPLTIAARAAGRTGLSYGASQSQQVEDKKKAIEKEFGKDYERAAATYSSILPGDWQGKAALSRYLTETKGAKALGELTDFQRRDLFKTTSKYDPSKLEDMAKTMPEMINDPEVGKIIQSKVAPNMEALVGKMKPEDFKNVSEAALKDVKFLDAVITKAMGEHVDQLVKGHSRKAAEAIEKRIRENAGSQTPMAYLKGTNSRLHNFFEKGRGGEIINISDTPTVFATPGAATSGFTQQSGSSVAKSSKQTRDTGKSREKKPKAPDTGYSNPKI